MFQAQVFLAFSLRFLWSCTTYVIRYMMIHYWTDFSVFYSHCADHIPLAFILAISDTDPLPWHMGTPSINVVVVPQGVQNFYSVLINIDLFLNVWFVIHDDVIKWRHFSYYWPFVRGIHRSPVNSPHNGQWRGALMFSFICVWINGWVNNCHRAHYDVIVMIYTYTPCLVNRGHCWPG